MKRLLVVALVGAAVIANAGHLHGFNVKSYIENKSVTGTGNAIGGVKSTTCYANTTENNICVAHSGGSPTPQSGTASLGYTISLDVYWFDTPPAKLYLQRNDASGISVLSQVSGTSGNPTMSCTGTVATDDVSLTKGCSYSPSLANGAMAKVKRYSLEYTNLQWDNVQTVANGIKIYKLHDPLTFSSKTSSASGSTFVAPTFPYGTITAVSQGASVLSDTYRISADPLNGYPVVSGNGGGNGGGPSGGPS